MRKTLPRLPHCPYQVNPFRGFVRAPDSDFKSQILNRRSFRLEFTICNLKIGIKAGPMKPLQEPTRSCDPEKKTRIPSFDPGDVLGRLSSAYSDHFRSDIPNKIRKVLFVNDALKNVYEVENSTCRLVLGFSHANGGRGEAKLGVIREEKY